MYHALLKQCAYLLEASLLESLDTRVELKEKNLFLSCSRARLSLVNLDLGGILELDDT